jgi:RNA-directed DNA polymerase
MSGKRQKIQLELALFAEERGEAARAARLGTEPGAARREAESQVLAAVMEAVVALENVKRALRKVCSKKGSPGVDGMTVKQLPKYLMRHWDELKQQLLAGTYHPQPVLRKEVRKPDGGVRLLGIPTVLDRFVQQALLQVLQPQWDPSFSDSSYGFRPGRSQHQAVARAQGYICDSYSWVVDIDLEKFFDRVNHDILMSRVALRVSDKRALRVIRAFLTSGVLSDGLVSPTEEGTPQGGPLSPLLSNLLLDDLDRELESRSLLFVRYADDCNIYVRSQRAGERVMGSISRFLTQKLKLRVNEAKSAVGRPWERKFLGFTFTRQPQPKRLIAKQSIRRFKDRVREITARNGGRSLGKVIEELSRYLTGWLGYYGYCEVAATLETLEAWLRRRLRSLLWKQWKTARRRRQELVRRGIRPDDAARIAGSSKGQWRLSATRPVQKALTNNYFAGLGLPSLTKPTP